MRTTIGLGLLLSVVACTRATPTSDHAPREGRPGAPPAPPSPPAPPPIKRPPPKPMPSCVTPSADGPLALDAIKLAADTVAYCVAADPRSCWIVDVATGTYTAARSDLAPAPLPPALPTATVQPDGSVQLCPTASTACVAFRAPPPDDPGATWSVSDDLKYVARVPSTQQTLDVFEVATGKRKAHIKAWKTDMGNPSYFDAPTFAGDRLIAWIHASPVSDAGRIFTLTGRKVGDVAKGERWFSQNTVDTWHLDGTQWAFKQLDASKLVIVDVKTAKKKRVFDLAPLSTAGGSPGDTTPPAAVAAFGDTLLYLAQTGTPVLGVLDRKTGKVRALPAPRCGQ